MRIFHKHTHKQTASECEQEARLEAAEKDLGNLKHRAHSAIVYLEARNHRNHWRESVEDMIRGRA